jgi:hypothetical protein
MRAMATLAFLGALLVAPLRAQKYEYKVVTIVESVIPMGLGRLRMIETTSALDYKEFTGSRGEGRKQRPLNQGVRAFRLMKPLFSICIVARGLILGILL